MLGKIEGWRRRGQQRMRGWMASPTQWTWVWVNSGIWWWTGRPGMLQSMGSQRVGQDWATELNWTEGRVWGLYSLVFIPAPFSRGEGWLLSLFSLDQKCHGLGARWVLFTYKANFIVKRAQWATGYIGTQEMSTFPHDCFQDILLPRHYHSKGVVSCQSGGSCFPLLWTPSVYRMLPACCNNLVFKDWSVTLLCPAFVLHLVTVARL